MLRITEQQENETTLRLRLDGTLDSTSFAELQHTLPHGSDANRWTVILDMAGVTFMNQEAASQLAKLRNQSLHIVNGSPFVEMLLNSAL